VYVEDARKGGEKVSKSKVFFDLDGTLHKGDIFRGYVKFLAPKNFPRLALLFPLILTGLILYVLSPDKRWSLNLLLWPLTWLITDTKRIELELEFIKNFKKNIQEIPFAREATSRHLDRGGLAYVISGSPEHLICAIYDDLLLHDNVQLIGSRMGKRAGAYLLRERCVCAEKPRMLMRNAGSPMPFDFGYSDSEKDIPMLNLCARKYKVELHGGISDWDSI
jgi:phosphatidylglycerophosphatase C